MLAETDTSPFTPQSYEEQNDDVFQETLAATTLIQYVQQPQKKFVERHQYAIDDKFEYHRNGNDQGLVLIFNQENIPGCKVRRGSRRDVNEIVECLQRQGFNIDDDCIMTDGTAKEITAKLKEVSEMDLSQRNCLIIFILTHGDELEKLHTKDGDLRTWEIWGAFARCKDLNNKPKMFIFQACKGESYTTPNTVEPLSASKIVPYRTFSTNQVGPDMLIVYSTIEGNVSFRHPLSGSWFIQELCKNFTAYGRRDDVVSLVIRTTKCVCGNYYHYEDHTEMKQMPMFVSTLSKKFYLNRNKDRDMLIRVLDSNEKILDLLKGIKDKLDKLQVKEEEKKKKPT
ncbi:hypothetical protein NQ318_019341 [Aromia moschata]|uniref:Caspase-3 n=1 Tax=Aromia moschata TaxID=1265417 RepID=A0AAV8YAP9_9CUCU|nr:hypothetical protein NQ318_019341 [Aromia moschata]